MRGSAGQTIPTGIQRVNGPLPGPFTAPIAILDTGVGPHPDLNVVSDYSCISGKSATQDQNGHGTHVAGIAAAIDNGYGVVGVAPGTPIHNVKVRMTCLSLCAFVHGIAKHKIYNNCVIDHSISKILPETFNQSKN